MPPSMYDAGTKIFIDAGCTPEIVVHSELVSKTAIYCPTHEGRL
jgi:hypothetical protein